MGRFEFQKTPLEGVYEIIVEPYGDERGYFCETYNLNDFRNNDIKSVFVQDNQSKSVKGVLRGLHFQKKFPQSKLVRVIEGEVFDVAVDIRKESKNFGKWFGTILSEQNKKQLFIPRGFAHGFQVLSDVATFCYKCDEFYHPEDEDGIIWDDPDIGIEWPLKDNIILSEKDKNHQSFKEYVLGGRK